jgi:hypothetical protein
VVTPEILRKACALIGQALNEREAAVRLKVSKIALYEALASSPANARYCMTIRAAPLGGKAGAAA